MNDAVNVWMFGKDFLESFRVCDVDVVELWSLSAYQLDAVENLGGCIVEAVDV